MARHNPLISQQHHPLNWAAYLRQSLVFEPVPATLTLMLILAHYHAVICWKQHASFDQPQSFNHQGQRSPINETSFIGYAFAAVSRGMAEASGLFVAGWGQALPQLLSQPPCIDTPLHVYLRQKRSAAEQAAASPGQPSKGGENPVMMAGDWPEYDEDSGSDSKVEKHFEPLTAERILRASTNDPFTIAYSAWTYLSSSPSPDEYKRRDGKKKDGVSGGGGGGGGASADAKTCNSGSGGGGSGGGEKRDSQESEKASVNSVSLIRICVIHAVAMAAVFFSLVPSICANSSYLACNQVRDSF